MDKQAFKQRMQNLKSYRENNPGKGYWDWKVQAYQNGGDVPLWQQYQYSGPSYQDVLDDLKQNSPSTYNQLQQSKAVDSQSSSEVVRYVDSEGRLQSTSNLQGLSPVITSDYLPGVGDAMEVTQIVQDVKNEDYGAALAGLGLLALPGNWLSKIKSKYSKKGLVNSIYNNVAPGSYYDSYIPGGSKKDELKGALKDYLLGKGDKIDPKWENWINSPTTLGSFIAKDNKKQQHMLDVMTAARKEAWQNYLGIPHDDRYLINTGIKENGMPVYRSNVTDVPNVQLRDIAKTTQHKPENIPYVHGDMINSTGGNISVKYRDNGDLRTITTEDIWDLNPFKDANRARILPEWLKNKYMHIEVQPDGYQKRVWNDNAPKWLVDLEPANLLGIPGPFLNRTTFNARLLNKDQAVKKVPISKEENETYNVVERLMDDPSYMRRAQQVKSKYGDDYTSVYADIINAYNESPDMLPKAKGSTSLGQNRAMMKADSKAAKRHMEGGDFPGMGEFDYLYNIDIGVPYGTTTHELNHFSDFIGNKSVDADGNSNMFKWMRSALKPYSDGMSKYFSKPTEQKAYMNQLREFMYANKMIDTRDQVVTPDLIKQAIGKLPKGMESIKKASEQFKSLKSYTKWFNTIPLLGAGTITANRYFNEDRDTE